MALSSNFILIYTYICLLAVRWAITIGVWTIFQVYIKFCIYFVIYEVECLECKKIAKIF